ncbi:MAG TPA: DUF6326 family protein [Anaerolineaceae bacterium]|nr:DUF6326 family protein [Anaerolineaceae bacterium]
MIATQKSTAVSTNQKVTPSRNRQAVLSTLWIFVMFNYLYCDVMSLMDPAFLKQYLAGNVGGIQISASFLLGAAVLMEIPISLVLLSRVLSFPANRWANIIAGAIMTLVQLSTLIFGSATTIYYLFFSAIEIACTAFIVWYAWKWPKPEA